MVYDDQINVTNWQKNIYCTSFELEMNFALCFKLHDLDPSSKKIILV